MTVLPYILKKMLIMSAMHRNDHIDEDSGDQRKPAIITFYNSKKSGVNIFYRTITSYNISINTKH